MHDVITFNCEHIMQWKIVLRAILKFFDGFDKFTVSLHHNYQYNIGSRANRFG